MPNLSSILAGVRTAEGGSLQGQYNKRSWYNGEEYYGAYGIPKSKWGPWSNFAGVRNAPIGSQSAQDRVAATVLAEYYNQYGNWDLAIIAWFAGPEQTNKLIEGGGLGALGQRSPETEKYLQTVMQGVVEADQNPQYTKSIDARNLNLTKPGSGWVNPVAGDSEWSRGSYMPSTNNHRGRTHGAIDVYAKEGTPIVSPVGGKIIGTKQGKLGGNTVRIMGDDGITYYFAHMASATTVTNGQRVNAGYHVGYVGNTGSAKTTSPHLHMSMKYGGKVVNPATYLEQASAFGYNDRAINAERAVASLENPSNTPNQSMMTGWLQGLSNGMAGGTPELPPINRIRADQADPKDRREAPATADSSLDLDVDEPMTELEKADTVRTTTNQKGPY
jgi:murein DD-endopeptidase MepM/ murein hydrolase activator NlpD